MLLHTHCFESFRINKTLKLSIPYVLTATVLNPSVLTRLSNSTILISVNRFVLNPSVLTRLSNSGDRNLHVLFCFESFRINKTLKRKRMSAKKPIRFESFRINKTLKHKFITHKRKVRFESFRINKTLKPQIRFSPSLTIQRQMAVNMTDLICKGLYPE